MSQRRSYLVVCLAVFAVALGMRTITLYWSPFPATLDGFDYAALARDTIKTGALPLSRFRADNFVYANSLAMVSAVTGVRPVVMAQPVVGVVGAASCLTAVAVVRRLGREIGLTARRVRYAALLAGLGLAIEGLYLRRTGVADEEVLGVLLVPLLAIAVHRTLRTRRWAWVGTTALLVLVFPLVHTFSTLVAGLTVIGVVATQILRVPSRRLAAVGVVFAGGFWVYFAVYYDLALRVGLDVPYLGRVLAFPGLFAAWLVALVVGVLWVRSTSPRLQRAGLIGVIALGFAVLVANVFLPVFPGTETTPLPILGLVAAFVVPALLASDGFPLAARDPRTGAVVLALLVAPVVETFFSLTASLTPEFFGTVMRTQTFVHVPIFVLAALAAVGATRLDRDRVSALVPTRWPALRRMLVALLLVSAAVTAPLAFIDLDTVTYPSTTTESEFAASAFATLHLTEEWATDDPLDRVGSQYYPDVSRSSQIPVGNWLAGGSPPTCPVLSARSWSTTGAHLFPQASATIPPSRYDQWLTQRNVVYTASGSDPLALALPRTRTNGC